MLRLRSTLFPSRLGGVVLGLAASLSLSIAQDSASLSVTVLDPSNASVPLAHVILKDTERGNTIELDTAKNGQANFTSLRPSSYSLQVEKGGFEKILINRMTIGVRDRSSISLDMKIARDAASISVSDTVMGVAATSGNSAQAPSS